MIGLRWLVKAWGWFPIFLGGGIPKCWPTLEPCTPCLLRKYLFDIHRISIHFQQIYFCESANLKSWCWKMRVPHFRKLWNLIFGSLEYWNFEILKLLEVRRSPVSRAGRHSTNSKVNCARNPRADPPGISGTIAKISRPPPPTPQDLGRAPLSHEPWTIDPKYGIYLISISY